MTELSNISYKPGKGIFVDGKLYDEGAIVNKVFTSKYSDLKPSYRIIPILDKQSINPGEKFAISFQITGNGKVESNLITIYYPPDFISSSKKSYLYSYLLSNSKTNNGNLEAVWFDKKPQENEVTKEGMGMFISALPITFKEADQDKDKRNIFGEKMHNGHSPLVFEGYSSKNASRGDNIINITFRYSDGGEWYISQENISIHVNSWKEEHPYLYHSILVLIGAFIIAFSRFIWDVVALFTELFIK